MHAKIELLLSSSLKEKVLKLRVSLGNSEMTLATPQLTVTAVFY